MAPGVGDDTCGRGRHKRLRVASLFLLTIPIWNGDHRFLGMLLMTAIQPSAPDSNAYTSACILDDPIRSIVRSMVEQSARGKLARVILSCTNMGMCFVFFTFVISIVYHHILFLSSFILR